MSAKFTQGEWSVEYDGSIVMNGQIVSGAIGIDGSTQEEKKANSMMIAAAPELLEACRQMMRWFAVEDDHSQMPEFIDRFSLCKQVEFIAASAIAKATGGAQ